MHEEGFAFLEAAALEHVVPNGEEGLGQRGSFRIGEASRHGQDVTGGNTHIFGIAAAGRKRADLVADAPARFAVAEGRDFARDLEARQVGRAGGRGIDAPALQDVGPVDAGGMDAHDDLAGTRLRHVAPLRFEHHRPARFGNGHRRHLGREWMRFRHGNSSRSFVEGF